MVLILELCHSKKDHPTRFQPTSIFLQDDKLKEKTNLFAFVNKLSAKTKKIKSLCIPTIECLRQNLHFPAIIGVCLLNQKNRLALETCQLMRSECSTDF